MANSRSFRCVLLGLLLALLIPAVASAADPLMITTATNHTGYVDLEAYRIPTNTSQRCISLSNSPTKTGPVRFYLDGSPNVYQTENTAPWDMLSGGTNDANGQCRLGTLPTGNHSVRATWTGGEDSSGFVVGPVPDTSISAVADADSAPTFIDEDGNGSEQVNVTFSGTNATNRRECALSGATIQAYANCTSVWAPTVNVGSNTVSVRACDNAGCDTTPATSTFTMQAAPPPPPPNTTISAVADNDSPTLIDEDGNGSEAVTVSFSGTNSPTSYTCSVSGATTIGSTACTSPWQATVNVGSNTVTVTACNSGGCDTTPATNTFTMQAAPPPSDPLVSQGDPAAASSFENPPQAWCSAHGGCAAGQAFDGDLTGTRWASVQAVDPQWVYVDLGANYNVSRVKLTWEAAYASAYKIQRSPDASVWTDIYSTTTGDGGTDDLTVSGAGRYVRMLGTTRATAFGYSLWEMQVYGTTAPPPPPQCSDFVDNADPEDTLVDYPVDPGCTSASDNDETDPSGPTPPPAPGTWHVTFEDNFDTVDTSKWGFKFWWNGDSFWPTLELQIYKQQNCTAANGELIMTANAQTPPITNYNNNTRNSANELFQYFSCWMSTGGSQNDGNGSHPAPYLFTYGYAEARMKMGQGKGIWPGFWMQGRDSTNGTVFDDAHEIDVVEVVGTEPNSVNMAYHGPSGASTSVYATPAPVGDDYHVFAIDWEPGKLDWYVDGVLRKTLTRSDVPTTPRYVMLNHAVGGAQSWPGAPDGSTVFPNITKVDYVRVWQQ